MDEAADFVLNFSSERNNCKARVLFYCFDISKLPTKSVRYKISRCLRIVAKAYRKRKNNSTKK
jgi:hypothetical protein